MTEMAQERTVRDCDICGQEDTDPRHVVAMDDGSMQTRHMQCCRDAGCPDGTCDELMAGAGDVTGQELIDYLTGEN